MRSSSRLEGLGTVCRGSASWSEEVAKGSRAVSPACDCERSMSSVRPRPTGQGGSDRFRTWRQREKGFSVAVELRPFHLQAGRHSTQGDGSNEKLPRFSCTAPIDAWVAGNTVQLHKATHTVRLGRTVRFCIVLPRGGRQSDLKSQQYVCSRVEREKD
jgi:hypothetical protein